MVFPAARLNALQVAVVAAAVWGAGTVQAHGHHDRIPEGEGISPDPIDSILWVHIIIQIVVWGIIFPTGMLLGIIKSRLHVPLQVLGTVLAIVGYFLGHKHKGRQFSHNAHSGFAPWLGWMLSIQILLGIYLKLHIEKGFLGRIRGWLVMAHGILGKALPVASWVQMLLGGIATMGFCRGDHLGQCLAHFIMGSAFIGYGILLTILLLVGQYWLRRTGRSQEFFDSLVIAVWGCVNTFTEHRWGGPWVKNDLQHTTMGIIWWCAGLVGIWLSGKRDGSPKRNLIPGIVIILTGYAMSSHPQALMLSTEVHKAFGWTLMAAGATRIVEIAFVLKDAQTISMDGTNPHSFQYIPVFLLYASGFLFMGATEEQMEMLTLAHVSHVSYILILYSIAFITFLFVNVLLHMYATNAPHSEEAEESTSDTAGEASSDPEASAASYSAANGRANGGVAQKVSERESRQAQDAEEFELDALISDDEDEDDRRGGEDDQSGSKRTKEGQLRLR